MNEIKHKNFLFEIGTEELPPKRIGMLASSLAANIKNGLQEQALEYESVKIYSTPRRIAVLVINLITKQPDQSVEFRGPPINIPLAADKFAKTCGVPIEKLSHVDGKLFHKTIKPGKETSELLPEIAINSVKKLPIPKPMRWGDNVVSFVRPVHWVVMLFGQDVINTEILGIKTSNQTFGHRFHYPKAITIPEASQYEELLKKFGFVIASLDKRKQKIFDQITAAVKTGTAIINDNLLNEVTDLVEWPITLIGSFDPHFLEIPKEVLITLMEKQQRYFPIVDANKNLLPNFAIISNIDSKNPPQVVLGNERVIRARLTDAEYFYKSDLSIPLINYGYKLESVVFQEKLGSLYDKTLRLRALTNFIAIKINVATGEHADRAAELSKCDLLTSMVCEFPELQGIMGDYYARVNENKIVATAIKEQYLPRFSQDELPTTNIGLSLALADKVDNLIGMFGINKIPSGEKDPFGLRRAATGIVRIILEKKLTLNLKELLEQARLNYKIALENKNATDQVLNFIHERLRYMYAEQGKSANVFRDVLACQSLDLLDFEKRFDATTEFNKLPEANDLIEIYKRVKNILNKADPVSTNFNKQLATESAEHNLAEAIEKESKTVAELYANKNYFEILKLLVKIKPYLNDFFDKVMVMTEDKKIRLNRLALLKKLQKLFTLVTDWGS